MQNRKNKTILKAILVCDLFACVHTQGALVCSLIHSTVTGIREPQRNNHLTSLALAQSSPSITKCSQHLKGVATCWTSPSHSVTCEMVVFVVVVLEV